MVSEKPTGPVPEATAIEETTRTEPEPEITFEPEPEHPNLTLAKNFLKTYQNLATTGRQYITDDFVIQFGEYELGFEEYAREAQKAFDSMTNVTFRYKSMEYCESNNTVVLQNLVLLSGDTAKAEQKGETITYFFRDGKISKQLVQFQD